MGDQNPFSSYSTDEQNYIADQLRTAASSGKLNPAQIQGVQNALKYLPMSKEQAADTITNAATLGMGKWQKPRDTGPTFAQSDLVDPQAKEFGGPILRNTVGWDSKKFQMVPGQEPIGPSEMVERQNVKQARASLQDNANPDFLGMEGADWNNPLTPLKFAWAAKDYVAGQTGEVISHALDDPYLSPNTRAVVRGVSRFGGQMLGDPVTYATLGIGGKGLTAGFTALGAKGTYEGASQLYDIWSREDIPTNRKVELATNVTLNAMMMGLAGTHTIRSFLKSVPEGAIPPEHQEVIAQQVEQKLAGFGPLGTYKPGPGATAFPNEVIDRTQPFNTFGYSRTQKVVSGERTYEKDVASAQGTKVPPATPAPESGVPASTPPIPMSPERLDAKPDTDFYAKAKSEWMDKNPGMSPDKGISWIARRANELKTGVPDKTLAPEAPVSPTGVLGADDKTPQPPSTSTQNAVDKARAGEVAQPEIPSAPKTPVAEPAPKELSPKEKASLIKPGRDEVYDLRLVDSDVRHEWVNQNSSGFNMPGPTAADAARQAREMFGQDRKFRVNSYLDKDGILRHTLRLEYDAEGQPAKHVSPAKPEEVSQLSRPGQIMYEQIQDTESKFHEITGGKHGQVLKDLYAAVDRTIPDAPRESKLALYQKALKKLVDIAPNAKGPADFAKAFDIATKKSEGGFLGNKTRIRDEEWERLAKLSADTVLTRFEALPEAALAGRKIVQRLMDPIFRNSVYSSEDSNVVTRYEVLLNKAGGARATDPITAMGLSLEGQVIRSGQFAQDTMRGTLASIARTSEQRTAQLRAYRDSWNHKSIADVVAFYDNVEHGNFNAIEDPVDREFAKTLRQQYDLRRDQLVSMGLLDHFNENYVGRLWRYGIKDAAAAILSGRRNLAATPSSLRARTYDTFSEGIAAGLEPVTYNPVDMFSLKMAEMDKYLAAKNAFDILKDSGLVKTFDPKEIPYNWQPLDHRMFNTGSAKFYAPADVVRKFNNYLAPGLRGNMIYDVLSHYNNVVNQFNLGFSAFHATETAVNASVSRFALGLQQLTRFSKDFAPLKGLANVALGTAGAPFSVGKALWTGNRVFQEYLTPGRYADLTDTVNALESGGMRIRMSPEYKNAAAQGFRNAWLELKAAKGFQNIPKSGQLLYRSLGAVLEKMSVPLMEYFVPRVKLGTAAMMAEDALGRLEGAPRATVVREMSKIWDSVDNRFGQVVYDNLMWNRMGKDIAHLMIRSVGWNYGTVRELGGAVFNVGEYKGLATGKGLGYKQSYTLALLGITGMMGYIMNAFYQGTTTPKIDGTIDLLYPATGKMNPDGSKERVYIKTYVHDMYAFAHDAPGTVANKLAPEWHQIAELFRNADYYGNQIRPIHATTTDALQDPQTYIGTGKYLLQQAEPFSVRNFIERYKSGEGVLGSMTSGAAVLPAPKWVGQSKAEQTAFELFKTKLGQGPNDPLRADTVKRYHELASGYAAGRYTSADLNNARLNSEITFKQYEGIIDQKEGQLSPLERHVKQLNPDEVLKVWNVATPDEKRVLTGRFLQSWDSIEDKYPEARASDLLKQFRTAWQTFKTGNQSN